MSSLYQIYLDGLKRLRGIETPEDFSGMSSDLTPPETDASGRVKNPMLREREGGSPLTQPGGQMFPTSIVPQNILNQNNINRTPDQANMPSDPIVTGGMGAQFANDSNFLSKLSNLAGIDFDKAANTWKDKGGFEGLMANPAFTLGLAFMQAGAEGKSIGQAGLNSVLKAGQISQQYKKLIESRSEVLEVTASDVADMKAELENYGFADPNAAEQLFGKVFKGVDSQKTFDKAAEKMALAYKKEVRKRAKAAGKDGKDFVVDSSLRKQIIEKIIKDEKLKVKKGLLPFGLTKGTIEADKSEYTLEQRAEGGPVEAGKPYVVGEEGPEVIIPKSDGNVLTNDDSQIYAMLLAANPQLQQVSRQRAEKILRARFPEYFEG